MTTRLIVGLCQIAIIGPMGIVPSHRCLVPVIGVGLDREFELTTASEVRRARLMKLAARVPRSANKSGVGYLLCDPGIHQQSARVSVKPGTCAHG